MTQHLRIAVIADDLTGAADTGVQFCPAVGPVLLTTAGDQLPGDTRELVAGLAVSTDSRHLDSRSAEITVHRCAGRIAALAPELIYKKIDSCLRGNLGVELDALLEATGAAASLVAPAYPAQGRTTVNDVHRLHGVPVAETEIGSDPLAPVRESRLSVLLAGQSRFLIGRIGLAQLSEPADRLLARVQFLIDRGHRHLVFDAETTGHLAIIAALAHRLGTTVLPVGSAGMAGSLARIMAGGRPAPAGASQPLVKRWLFVCGSASPVLARQASRLATATGWPLLTLTPAALLTGDADVAQLAGQPHSLILTVAARTGSGPAAPPDRIVRALAAYAADLVPEIQPDALFLSGGDTAEAVRRSIGATALLLHEEVLPGLVRAELIGGHCHGLTVITKAGGFGEDDTLITLVNH
jgi:D-threonate/D-erythronate kinase